MTGRFDRSIHEQALIVDEEMPPDVDYDEVLVLDDWRLDAEAQIDERVKGWAT